ncbi:hypothetical protein LL965_22685 [Xanthomonas cassavae CFBP 4642]|uniref:Uncharacterized protein n=1 Tax=Xanthomonas cassavae CFBP 4642 TaxID=1219375 RepID=A0ABS8HKI5_9XANT|nr:hypothetical protein [Xanthomonas cassavae]MCC4622698.1 hypothetical protein [Xanthomonas cassavae CFBP 4642]
MVEWWSCDARHRRRIYIQLVFSAFFLIFTSFFLLTCLTTTTWQAAIAISACLFPISLNTATILSQHLLRRFAGSEAPIERSTSDNHARPKCTVAIPCIVYGRDEIDEAIATVRQNFVRNHGLATFFVSLSIFLTARMGLFTA